MEATNATNAGNAPTGGAPDHRMFIAGKWTDAADGARITSINPATEQPLGCVPDAHPDDLDQAVAAAVDAAPGWAAAGWQQRASLLREFCARITERAAELAELDTRDSGNPITGMRYDLASTPPEILYYAGIGSEAKGFTAPTGPETLAYTTRQPYGVVARIIPFNHPFKFAAGKIAAPLAAGNCVLLKPAEQTPLSAIELARLAEDLFPPGVLSVLTGTGPRIGAAIASHPGVPRVAFTGSVPTGRAVLAAGAPHIKHVTLELGGKNPIIVFPDVDPAKAARAAITAMNLARSNGQSCGSASRVFVHDDIRGPFLEALVRGVQELRVGDPLDDSTEIGPLAFERHYQRVLSYIAAGRDEGATLLTGGDRPSTLDRGYFIRPAVFADVTDQMTIAREEIFGPVISVLGWRDVDNVVRRANAVEYGLTANVWTRDISVAHRLVQRLDAGYVYVNGTGRRPTGTAFGGWKQSGIGKENSLEELLSYTREKSVAVTL
ncbi:MAG: aldehyde dehydrogenase family protein [Micromonosporaceae bacterium]|nr:aldehyde dehydrogenase family protein [Micromonosporaceae bacterium]